MIKFDRYYFLIVGKTLLIQVLLLCSIVGILWGSQKIYESIDKAVFEEGYTVQYSKDMTEEQKGIELLNAATAQLRYELDSPFGWTANDFLFNSYIMDNRAYRQYGVYVSTKMIVDHYSTVVAKLGNSDREDDNLYDARLNYLAISPSRWGMLFIPSAEGSYEKALKLMDKYKADLAAGKAVYNARTDDIYSAFNLVLGETIMGHALGLLQDSKNEQSFSSLDNKIYEVQGMMLVVRDYIKALYTLYPEIALKNNEENMQAAMDYLDKICTYNPMYITPVFNSGELIISYLLFAKNRLEDIRDSIRI